jgi:NAD(P)H-flavin reductase
MWVAPVAERRRDPMRPLPYRVIRRRAETPDTASLWLAPVAERVAPVAPGQFTMLYVPGVGEVPVSVSGGGSDGGTLLQTIRAVGAVTRALHDAPVGSVVGVRGPFGTSWDLPSAHGTDLVVVGGGCGLAPLRPVLTTALAQRSSFGRILAVLGAREPCELMFAEDVETWAQRPDVDVLRTVDQPDAAWSGGVGLVTDLVADAELDPARTSAFLCGPEVMIGATAALLLSRGVPARRIQVSLERNMKCGIGHCGHCQLGPLLVCRDGPVVPYETAAPLLAVREL